MQCVQFLKRFHNSVSLLQVTQYNRHRSHLSHAPPTTLLKNKFLLMFKGHCILHMHINKATVVNSIQVSKRKPVTCSIDLFCYYTNVHELIVLASCVTLREGILQPGQPSHQHHKYSRKLNDEWTILFILEHFEASTFLCQCVPRCLNWPTVTWDWIFIGKQFSVYSSVGWQDRFVMKNSQSSLLSIL